MAKLDKYTEGFFLGLNEKNWKYLKTPGVSPEEYLILANIHRLNNLIPDESTMKRFSAKQQKSYKLNGRTAGYIDAFQIMNDVKQSKTVGNLFKRWELDDREKAAAVGQIAAVNQRLQNISGLAENALKINAFFKAGGTAAKAAPFPWVKAAGFALTALSTILPLILKEDGEESQTPITQPVDATDLDMPGIPKQILKERREGPQKPPQKPPQKTPQKPGGDWFKPIRKAIIPTGVATGAYEVGKGAGDALRSTGEGTGSALKDTGKGIKDNLPLLVLGGLAIYFLFGKGKL